MGFVDSLYSLLVSQYNDVMGSESRAPLERTSILGTTSG